MMSSPKTTPCINLSLAFHPDDFIFWKRNITSSHSRNMMSQHPNTPSQTPLHPNDVIFHKWEWHHSLGDYGITNAPQHSLRPYACALAQNPHSITTLGSISCFLFQIGMLPHDWHLHISYKYLPQHLEKNFVNPEYNCVQVDVCLPDEQIADAWVTNLCVLYISNIITFFPCLL